MNLRFITGRLATIVPASVLALALFVLISDPGSIKVDTQNYVFDFYQRTKPREYVDPKTVAGVGVKYIDIDDESLSRVGQWPWPRTIIAQLVANAANMGAYAIVFDVVFAEPDRTSPDQVVAMLQGRPGMETLMDAVENLPDNDTILADIFEQAGNVVSGFVLIQQENDVRPAVKAGFSHAGDDPRQFISDYVGAVKPLDVLEEAAAGNGSFNFVTERDSIIRRVPLMVRLDDQLYPTLAAEALRVIQGASTYIVKSSGANMEESFGESTGINHVKVGRIIIPTTSTGRLWLHYTNDEPTRRIPAWRVLTQEVDPRELAASIVFVGTSAAGLFDLRATPLNPAAPGVEVHLQALEQILLEHYLSRPDWGIGAEIVFLFVFGVLLLFLLRNVSAVACALVAITGVAFAIGSSWYLYVEQLFLLDPVGPSVTVALMFTSGTLMNFLRTEAEKAQVRGAFGQYLSPALVEQLAEDPDRLKLGGETKEMTFLFCDIRGFTPISEQFKGNPQGLTQLINRFLTPMTDAILERRGTIDKYMGDCIMAFWNAPLDDPNHVEHACVSALVMIDRLQALNTELKAEAEAEGRPFLAINVGIGLNTGTCVVGNMGSQQRFDYSVLGDAVNLAARLEGQSKTYGVTTIVGQETYERVKHMYTFLELDRIAVKGKEEAVRIYTMMGGNEKRTTPQFRELESRHNEMLAAYRAQNWMAARAALEKERCLDLTLPEVCALYEERIAAYEADPPEPDWDGVFRATTK